MKPPPQPPEFPLAELLRVGFTEVPAPVWVSMNTRPLVKSLVITCGVLTILILPYDNSLPSFLWESRYIFLFAAAVCGLLVAVEKGLVQRYYAARSMVSSRSTQIMFCFRRSDATDGQEEHVYVDQESRTYFCMAVNPPLVEQAS